jgi:hypothetical protein
MKNAGWKALLVRDGFERVVAAYLHRQGIEHYLPLLESAPRTSGQSLAFSGYVFCKPDVPDALWKIPGVRSILQGAREIERVFERDLTDLGRILVAGLPVQQWPFTPQGPAVTIQDGPLGGITGILEQSASGLVFVFSIQLIRRSIALSVNNNNLSLSVASSTGVRAWTGYAAS